MKKQCKCVILLSMDSFSEKKKEQTIKKVEKMLAERNCADCKKKKPIRLRQDPWGIKLSKA